MTTFNIGDIVRIGKGKVEYEVIRTVEQNDAGTGAVLVQNPNNARTQTVEQARLSLVRASDELARVESIATARPAKVSVPETYNTPNTLPLRIATPGVVLWIDGTEHAHKTFDAAAFALSRTKYTQAAIFRDGKRVVKRAA